MMSLPNMEETVNCFGMILFKRWLIQGITRTLYYIQKNGSLGNLQYAEHFNNRVVLSNSFFGLEKARALPPNVHLTGPLVQPQGNLLRDLEVKHNKLFLWLEEALARNQPVVYISIGSYCIYQ